MQADFAAIRQAPVMAALRREARGAAETRARLGFDPVQDLSRVIVAVAGRGSDVEPLVVLGGTLSLDAVRAALARQGGRLREERLRGRTLYRDEAGGLRLFSPGEGLVVFVGSGWVESLLDRLDGRGRSVLVAPGPLGGAVRAIRGRRAGWVASSLSRDAGRHLGERLGAPELERLVTLSGSIEAADRLELRVSLLFDEEQSAARLEERLKHLARQAAALGSPLGGLRAERQRREVQVRLALGAPEIEAVLARLRRG